MGDANETGRPAGRSAGRPTEWLVGLAEALDGRTDSDVDCSGCVACCASSQFVLVEPTDTAALAAIPADLLVPAPRMPGGHLLMGYDARGRCPMLTDSGCSIYDSRPRTCRTYDCRIFAATGVAVDDDKPSIAARVTEWRFDVDDPADRSLLLELRQAADALRGPDGPTGTALAVSAVRVRLRRS